MQLLLLLLLLLFIALFIIILLQLIKQLDLSFPDDHQSIYLLVLMVDSTTSTYLLFLKTVHQPLDPFFRNILIIHKQYLPYIFHLLSYFLLLIVAQHFLYYHNIILHYRTEGPSSTDKQVPPPKPVLSYLPYNGSQPRTSILI